MELDKSYRGSSSAQASAYKRKGHDDEDIFAYLIDGTVISGTGKCDVKDSNAKTYSVKGGAKKWQIFLYGENRFKDDNGFHFANLGNSFLDALNSFPKDYDAYKNPGRYCSDFRGSFIIKDSGHWVQQEKPHEVNSIIKEFLEQL